MMEATPRFGELLAQARNEQGITQAELARRTGSGSTRIAQPNIARLESNDRTPNLTTLQTLAGALGGEIVIKASGAVEIRIRGKS